MSYLLLALTGLLGGLASGLFGIGGGLIFVPLLILIRHVDSHLAVGTSIAVIVPTALIAAMKHGKAGMIDWKAVPLLVLFAVLGAWLGASLSLQMNPLLLRRLFAVLLLVLSVKMFFPN